MDPITVGWLGLLGLAVLLFAGIPVAFSMLLIGVLGSAVLVGFGPALSVMSMTLYVSLVKYELTVVPLFILMGHFAHFAGFAEDLFKTAQKWLGHLRGGIVQAVVAGAAAFGAASGSGVASCTIVGKVTIPVMIKQGVDRKLAYGTVATAGTLATMIPPSIPMVIYGVITNTSIAKLLIAGILPGIVIALIYMGTVYIKVSLDPKLCPTIAKVSWVGRFTAIKDAWGIMLLAAVIMGGIYTGWFTPTEAAAVGAFAAFVLALILGRLKISDLSGCLMDTARTTGMIYFIVGSSFAFCTFLALTRLPNQISDFITGLDVNRYVILLGIVLFYIVMGCFIDVLPGLIITLPIVFPPIVKLGFHPIWFGVLIVYLMELGMVTPPFGINLFVLKGIIQDAKLNEIIEGAMPFIYAAALILFVLITFPQISLWLPLMMK
jgi:tripartite ATP-independent transporter DctM subunit